MFKKITLASLGFLLLASPLLTSAQTLSDLQAQIQALLAQITTLQAQQVIASPASVASDDYPSATSVATCPRLSVTLRQGSRDSTTNGQVSNLQVFLANQFGVSEETFVSGYFGEMTGSYVVQFQRQYNLRASGIVGALTRAKIAEVCGTMPSTFPPAPVTPISPDQTLPAPKCGISNYAVNTQMCGIGQYTGMTVRCQDGYSETQGGATSCKPASTWAEYATNVCANRCSSTGGTSSMSADLKAASSDTEVSVPEGGSVLLTWSSTGATAGCDIVRNGNTSGTVLYNAPASGTYTYMVRYYDEDQFTLRLDCYRQRPSGLDGLVTDLVSIRKMPASTGITVTAPNGGEKWEIGQLNTITWAPYGYNPDVNPASQVSVYLERADGTVAGRIMDTGKASLHTYFNLDNYQTWASPGIYYVRVKNATTLTSDRSNASFTLLPRAIDIKVNGSDGPVTLTDNQPIAVTFTVGTTFQSCVLHGVRATQSGSPEGINLTNSSLSTSFNGYAYAPIPGSSTAVYISCTKLDGGIRGDSVQVNMTGSAAALKIWSPNGGERFSLSEKYEISWQEQGIGNVSVALYKNDQWFKWIWKDIEGWPVDSVKLATSWRPSDVGVTAADAGLGNVYKIYITGQKTDGTGYVDDKSDAPFSFAPVTSATTQPAISLITPSDGAKFTHGSNFPFAWSVQNAPSRSQVEIEIHRVRSNDPNGAALETWRWQSPELTVGNSSGLHSSNVWDPGIPGFPVSTGTLTSGTYRVYAAVLACNPLGCSYPRLAFGGTQQQYASLPTVPPTFTIVDGPTSQTLPDLTIFSVTARNPAPSVNQYTTFNIDQTGQPTWDLTFRNLNLGATSGQFDVKYSVYNSAGRLITEKTLPQIATHYLTNPYPFTMLYAYGAGTYTYNIVINPSGSIAESNMSNNKISGGFNIVSSTPVPQPWGPSASVSYTNLASALTALEEALKSLIAQLGR